MNLIDIALEQAVIAHAGQTDKGGNPYVLHPLRIMRRLNTSDQELMTIALLHDAVEDSQGRVTADSLGKLLPFQVVQDILLLTHGDEDYMEYIKRVATSRRATLVKLQDLRDNSDITRLKGLTTKDFDRLAKYQIAYNHLKLYGAK